MNMSDKVVPLPGQQPSDEDVFTTVRGIISDYFEKKEEQITPQTTFFGDLGADSLEVIAIVMECEDTFGLSSDSEAPSTLGVDFERMPEISPVKGVTSENLKALRELYPGEYWPDDLLGVKPERLLAHFLTVGRLCRAIEERIKQPSTSSS